MTTLYAPSRKVKPAARKPFGLGVLPPQRDHRLPVGPSASDAAWWASVSNAASTQYEVAAPSDAEFDRMAEEAAALDAHDRGLIFA